MDLRFLKVWPSSQISWLTIERQMGGQEKDPTVHPAKSGGVRRRCKTRKDPDRVGTGGPRRSVFRK